jgi:cytoskeletal protein CcmA (bactofilin family)
LIFLLAEQSLSLSKGNLKMNNAIHNSHAVCAMKRYFWMAALCMLTLFLPVQAQVPDAKPLPTDAAGDSSASPSARNIYRAGGNVHLTAPVKGDFYAAGGRVIADQPVSGDASLAGGAVTVRAPVGEDLRAAGGDINIDSTVGGEVYASGGKITLGIAAAVSGAATLYGGNVNIEGKINGPLKVYAQKVVLNGEVARDVEINAEEIELGPRAKLAAALRYPGNAQFKTAEGVVIGGAVTRGDSMNGRRDTDHGREWHGQMMGSGPGWAGTVASIAGSFVVLLATSALFLLVFTGFSQRASHRLRATPWPALAAGVAVLLGTPMLATLLLITLIGIPLGIALMMLFPLMLLMGCIVGVFCISQRVQRAIQKEAPSETSTAKMGFFALTLLLVLLLGSLPFIGFLILVAIMLLGTGACALELYNQVRSARKPPKPSASDSGASSSTTVVGV